MFLLERFDQRPAVPELHHRQALQRIYDESYMRAASLLGPEVDAGDVAEPVAHKLQEGALRQRLGYVGKHAAAQCGHREALHLACNPTL